MKTVLLITISIIIGCIIGTLTHEFGHLLIALLFDCKVSMVRLFPFLQIFPEIRLVDFNLDFGEIIVDLPNSQIGLGLFYLAGSGLNAILSIIFVFILRKYKISVKQILFFFPIILIMALDIIFYSVFPVLGLPHWIIIGGMSPEPLDGALLLGFPQFIYFICLILYSVFVFFFIIKPLNKAFLFLLKKVVNLQ